VQHDSQTLSPLGELGACSPSFVFRAGPGCNGALPWGGQHLRHRFQHLQQFQYRATDHYQRGRLFHDGADNAAPFDKWHNNDAVFSGNGGAQSFALAILNGQPCTPLPIGVPLDAVVIGSNPPGTFSPGCYFRAGALDITASTTVTLSGAGVYIFRSTGGALTTGADSQVLLTNGACASNVFWAPVGATTLGANSGPSLVTPTFQGNILDAAGITIGHFANLTGRALAFGGTVTTDANTISVPTCAAIVGGPSIPTISEWAVVVLAALLGIAGVVAIRRKATYARRRG
jgi:hypothetical protein